MTIDPKSRPRLVLSGFMGTGKSTIARAVATRLGVEMIDLDEAIERGAGMTIPRIFAKLGEPTFRSLERGMLRAVLGEEGVTVIAVGGGALVDADNRALALAEGFVVTLDASADTIVARTRESDRPLLQVASPEERVRELLGARRDAYADCHLRVDTDASTVDEVVDRLLNAWSPP